MSENQTEESAILRELRQIKSDIGQIKEGQTARQISVAKIVTWQKALTAGLVAAGVIATGIVALILFLHPEQTTSINRLEDGFASQRNTACQCEKEN